MLKTRGHLPSDEAATKLIYLALRNITKKWKIRAARPRLLNQIKQLARAAIYGSLSETYRRCGNPDCRCHHGGPKHGPHLYISYRGKTGKTTGYCVPHQAEAQIRQGVDAWSQLQDRLRELAP